MAELGCIFNYNKTNKMKKLFAIVAIATLTACGGASTEVKTDSTAVAVDSTAVATDSSVASTATPTTEFEAVK
jgi:uncharacterized lipoprotein YajG